MHRAYRILSDEVSRAAQSNTSQCLPTVFNTLKTLKATVNYNV